MEQKIITDELKKAHILKDQHNELADDYIDCLIAIEYVLDYVSKKHICNKKKRCPACVIEQKILFKYKDKRI